MTMPYTEHNSAYASGPHQDTSHAAANHADVTREHRGRMYLKLLYARGPLTDHEAAATFGTPLSGICSTRNAVMVYELVEPTGQTKLSPYGQQAHTWRLTPAGKAAVVAMLPPVSSAPEPSDGFQGHDLNAPAADGGLF